MDSSRFIPLLLSPPLLPWVSPPLLPWVRDTLILPAIPMSRRPKGRTTKRSNRLVRESQAMAGQVRRMQNDDVWLIGLIQPGQTETVIGCLNEQAPMQLYTRSCARRDRASQAWQKQPILTFRQSLALRRGVSFARGEPGPIADARNQTATRCIPRAWFSNLQATNQARRPQCSNS